MDIQKLSLFIFLTCLLALGDARHLPLENSHDLQARLESGTGGLFDCWNALTELRSCTNEIVLFFLNGESSLGVDCCGAVRIITRQCWPAMLASIGFTAEEGDILRGYCDATTNVPPPSPANLGPASATAPVPALSSAAAGVMGFHG